MNRRDNDNLRGIASWAPFDVAPVSTGFAILRPRYRIDRSLHLYRDLLGHGGKVRLAMRNRESLQLLLDDRIVDRLGVLAVRPVFAVLSRGTRRAGYRIGDDNLDGLDLLLDLVSNARHVGKRLLQLREPI